MTLTIPEQSFGNGQTENYRLADPALVTIDHGAADDTDPVVTLFDYAPQVVSGGEARQAMLKELGLKKLAKAERRQAKLDFARVLYPELTGANLELWRKFLPTSYRAEKFEYDSVPDEALGLLKEATALDCFDRIEIWTPEGNDLKGRRHAERARQILARSTDPLAVGIIVGPDKVQHPFALFRWGESLAPIEEIKRYVATVDRQEGAWKLLGLIPVVLVALLTVGSFWLTGTMRVDDYYSPWELMVVVDVIGLLVTSLLFAGWCNRMIDWFKSVRRLR